MDSDRGLIEKGRAEEEISEMRGEAGNRED